jgi:endo-1,4-beta-xylanase
LILVTLFFTITMVMAQNATTSESSVPLMPKPLTLNAVVMPLWPPGSPMLNASKAATQEEKFSITEDVPTRIRQVVNVHNPSIEVHLIPPNHGTADDFNTGAAIILAPGGGNRDLESAGEGTDFIPFFYELGVNTFILRYRLQPDYTAKDANADAAQAIRMVRAHAKEWGIDPKKIGMMGFSAGGDREAYLTANFDAGDPNATDPVARASSRPDFVVGIYPSGSNAGVPKNGPTGFFVVSGEDFSHARTTIAQANNMLSAGIPFVELHLYAYGRHGDGMKDRQGNPLGTWQNRFVDWVRDLGFLNKPGVPTKVDAFSQQAPIPATPRGGGRQGGAAGTNAPATP